MTREFGDFQTPSALVDAVLTKLAEGGRWNRVLEPSAGSGGFVAALCRRSPTPDEVIAIEAQDERYAELLALAANLHVRLTTQKTSLFDVDLRALEWTHKGPLLVVGNPPWVTSASLSLWGSSNHPPKTNFLRLRGLDAITGRSNFDLATAMWLKLMVELQAERPKIGLLCKLAAAREVLSTASKMNLPIQQAAIYRIDARKWFAVSVEACLLVIQVGLSHEHGLIPVYPDLDAAVPEACLTIAPSGMVVDVAQYERSAHVDGPATVSWRQGLKHDAAAVMELSRDSTGQLCNRRGDLVDVEADYVYPLMKSSDVHRGKRSEGRSVIVTQRSLSDDTQALQAAAPKLWAYLTRHEAAFAGRRSRIYDKKPSFSIFGIGPYAFAEYKLAVAGLYPPPIRFRVVGPVEGRPTMLDDTCYFLPCTSARHAAIMLAVLRLPVFQDLIAALTLRGAKRPITKALLQRLDLDAAVGSTQWEELARAMASAAEEVGLARGEMPGNRRKLEGAISHDPILVQAAEQVALLSAGAAVVPSSTI